MDAYYIDHLYYFCEKGDLETVKELLSKCEGIHTSLKEWGLDQNAYLKRTPLYCAAKQGHLSIVDTLLTFGAEVNKGRADNGDTPLHGAIFGGYTEVVRLLVE